MTKNDSFMRSCCKSTTCLSLFYWCFLIYDTAFTWGIGGGVHLCVQISGYLYGQSSVTMYSGLAFTVVPQASSVTWQLSCFFLANCEVQLLLHKIM